MSTSITYFHDGTSRMADTDELADITGKGPGFVWIDITGPEPDDLTLMQDVLRFHPLTIEDTRNQRQRPKIEEYDGYLFIILNPVERTEQGIGFRELDVFLGHGYVATVHRDEEPVLAEAAAYLQRHGAASHTEGYLAYLLMDTVVDSYFPVLDAEMEAIDEMEDSLISGPVTLELETLFQSKRSLLAMQRVVSSQRDMFQLISHREMVYLPGDTLEYYLRDVQDHVLRINDQVNMAREMVASVIELYLTATSNELNRVVSRLTVFTIIVGVLGAFVGFYGMNFESTWPPHDAAWGVPVAVVMMAAISVGLLVWLRKLRWW